MVLLRQLLGDVLRRLRIRQGRTLREVSASARVSLGYLSEVERGRKEASSELLAAICAALETPLSQVFREVSDNFALAELQQDTVLVAPREPGLRVPAERIPGPRRHGRPPPGPASMACPRWTPWTSPPSAAEFADHRSGFDAAGGSVRDITDMVAV